MNQPQNPTDVAHKDLRNILLNGRILINGMPLTGNELGVIIQGEQMLYGKATKLDAAQSLSAQKKDEENPGKKPNIVPIRQPKKKE